MIDKKSRSVTSLFMLLAILVMAALAYSVSQRSTDSHAALTAPGAAMVLADWLERSIPEFAADQIRRVIVTYPDGETLAIGRESTDDPALIFAATAEGTKFGNALLETTAEVRADPELTGSAPVVASFETFDGLIVEISVYGSARLPRSMRRQLIDAQTDGYTRLRVTGLTGWNPDSHSAGFTKRNVNRSLSPIARYFSRSLSLSRNVGGRVPTPSGSYLVSAAFALLSELASNTKPAASASAMAKSWFT